MVFIIFNDSCILYETMFSFYLTNMVIRYLQKAGLEKMLGK